MALRRDQHFLAALVGRRVDRVEQVRAGDKAIDALEEQINEEAARTIALRPTLLPRWMAALNLFGVAIATFALGEQTFVPAPLKTLFQGLGFHGGLLTYYALTYYYLDRHDQAARDPHAGDDGRSTKES